MRNPYKKNGQYVIPGRTSRRSSPQLNGLGFLFVLVVAAVGFAIAALQALLAFVFQYWYVFLTLGVLASIPFILQYRKELLERKSVALGWSKLESSLLSLVELLDDNEEVWGKVGRLVKELEGRRDGLHEFLTDQYVEIVARIIADGQVTEIEMNLLKAAERSLGLEKAEMGELKKQGYLKFLRVAIEDGILTEEEERQLAMLRVGLLLEDRILTIENALLDELKEVRRLTTSELHPMQTSLPLKPRESCFTESPCYEIKRNRSEGKFYFSKGEPGILYVTDQRLVFAGSGAVSIQLKEILSVKVYNTDSYVEVVKAGRQTPYYFQCDRPVVMTHYISTLRDKITA